MSMCTHLADNMSTTPASTTMTNPSTPMASHQQMIASLEDRLPPLFECHHATVRYIRAGYYLDAIHSIIEGFSRCQASLQHQQHASSVRLIEIDSPISEEQHNLVIDRNPMDPTSQNGKGPTELLFLAMQYNLALSYHLYAFSAIKEASKDEEEMKSEREFYFQQEQVPAILGDALHLYEEFSIRMHNLNPELKSSLCCTPALQSNMRHVKLLQMQFR